MTKKIVLSNRLRQQIFEHTLASPAQEACGLVGGGLQDLCSYYPVKNIAANPEQEFLMDPAEQIAAMKAMRNKGESLTAIFHSHPASAAQPSARDQAMAYYPDTVYLILSLQSGQPEINAFYFDGTDFEQISIEFSRE